MIEATDIILDKNKETSVFKNNVKIKTQDGKIIESEYAEFNRKKNIVILKQKIIKSDIKKNKIETNFAEYNDNTKIFRSIGATKVTTTENYKVIGKDIIFDNKNRVFKSDSSAIITDPESNKIYLNNFEYRSSDNIFKSIGLVNLKDKNEYKFSQIYIDTKKQEIVGTDIKAYLNEQAFKINKDNKPRIFANSIRVDKKQGVFKKVILLCVIIEKMINVHPGLFNISTHMIKRKPFIMIML